MTEQTCLPPVAKVAEQATVHHAKVAKRGHCPLCCLAMWGTGSCGLPCHKEDDLENAPTPQRTRDDVTAKIAVWQ